MEAEAAAADPGSASAFMSLAWLLAPTVAPVAPVAHCNSARCPLLRLPYPRSHYPVSLIPVSRIPYPSIPYPVSRYPVSRIPVSRIPRHTQTLIPYPVIPCPGPNSSLEIREEDECFSPEREREREAQRQPTSEVSV